MPACPPLSLPVTLKAQTLNRKNSNRFNLFVLGGGGTKLSSLQLMFYCMSLISSYSFPITSNPKNTGTPPNKNMSFPGSLSAKRLLEGLKDSFEKHSFFCLKCDEKQHDLKLSVITKMINNSNLLEFILENSGVQNI